MSDVPEPVAPAVEKKERAFRGTVVITGASRGLGSELVSQACDLGFFVFALVRGSAPAETTNICYVSVDLLSEASIEQVTRKHDYYQRFCALSPFISLT